MSNFISCHNTTGTTMYFLKQWCEINQRLWLSMLSKKASGVWISSARIRVTTKTRRMFTGDFVTRDGLIPILVVLQECQHRISIEFERNSCKEPTVVINREPKQRHDYDLNSLRHFCRLGISLFFFSRSNCLGQFYWLFHSCIAKDWLRDYAVLRSTKQV